MTRISESARTHLLCTALAVATTLLTFGFTSPTNVDADGCSSPVAEMYLDGTSSSLIEDEEISAELGEYVNHCIYTLDTDSLDEALGDCVVISVTFEGSEPAPRLITVIKGWDEIVVQAEVTPSDGDLAWSWTGDGLNCDEPGCLDGETIQMYLLGSDFGLSDGVENCPWTRVQARFELEPAP